MTDRTNTLNQQLQDIFSVYQKSDLKTEVGRQALIKKITESNLPAYHKEVLQVVFFEATMDVIPTALYLLRKQEEIRHADALLKIESAALGERRKHP